MAQRRHARERGVFQDVGGHVPPLCQVHQLLIIPAPVQPRSQLPVFPTIATYHGHKTSCLSCGKQYITADTTPHHWWALCCHQGTSRMVMGCTHMVLSSRHAHQQHVSSIPAFSSGWCLWFASDFVPAVVSCTTHVHMFTTFAPHFPPKVTGFPDEADKHATSVQPRTQ
jgi:hypothetical protein